MTPLAPARRKPTLRWNAPTVALLTALSLAGCSKTDVQTGSASSPRSAPHPTSVVEDGIDSKAAQVWSQLLSPPADFGSILELASACLERMEPNDVQPAEFGTLMVHAKGDDLASQVQLRIYPVRPEREVDLDNLLRFRILIESPDAHWGGVLGDDVQCTLDIQFGFTHEAAVFCTTLAQSRFHHTTALYKQFAGRDPLRLGGGLKVTPTGSSFQPYAMRVTTNPKGEAEWTTALEAEVTLEKPTLEGPEINKIRRTLQAFAR